MQYRVFGKTGLRVSELGFGGIPILRLETSEAVRILRHAFHRGITFYDTANAYKDSEEKMGLAFEGMRHEVIIATKTLKRDAAGAIDQLENSLRMLRTDYIDLYQLHQVAQAKDWEAITAPGGAMDAVIKAQQAGKIRCIGVTSHNLEMAIRLVKTGLFSSVQFPFNFIETEATELHTVSRGLNIGILAMKPFAGGAIDDAKLAFRYLRQYPDVLTIPGYDSVEAVDSIVTIYDSPNTFEEADKIDIEKYFSELGKQFCRRCEYCQPCPSGVMITLAMGYPLIAKRMSPKVAVSFAGTAMESTTKCTECGLCKTHCPYELPIPEILKKNYAIYKAHSSL